LYWSIAEESDVVRGKIGKRKVDFVASVQFSCWWHSIQLAGQRWGSENLFGSLIVGGVVSQSLNDSSSRPAKVSGNGESIDAVPRAVVTNC
jgi:hypothetical protein